MAGEWKVVPSFGGGLNFTQHPAFLEDDQWTGCDGWRAVDGVVAETALAYVQRIAGFWEATVPATHYFNGLHQDPFTFNGPLLTLSPQGAGGAMRLIRWNGGAPVEITWDAVGTAPVTHTDDITQIAFCNGFCVITGGTTAPAGNYSLLQWNGTLGTFSAINPTNPLRAAMLASYAGRLIVAQTAQTAAGIRTLRWADANSTTVWDAAISNSADTVVMEDSLSGITGLYPIAGNALMMTTREATYALSPTGAIPAFTIQRVSDQGGMDDIYSATNATPRRHSLGCVTPYGAFVRGLDDWYLNGQSTGRRVWRYIANGDRASFSLTGMSPVWHARYGAVGIPFRTPTGTNALLWFDPRTGTWSAQSLPFAAARHAVIRDRDAINDGTLEGRHWIMEPTSGQIYVQDYEGETPQAGGTVDSKDFTVGSPPMTFEVDRIKVDWETIEFGGSLIVQALMRPGLKRDETGGSVTGTEGFDITFAGGYVTVGTLTDGDSELSCRLRGKFLRWRFVQSVNRARIRGFAFRVMPVDDRRRA